MLVLREYIENQLTDQKTIVMTGRTMTIGRASQCDLSIGQNFHPVIQRSISRVQATLFKDDDDEITIVDGVNGSDDLSLSGIWYRGHRVVDFLTLEPNKPVVVFQWQKTVERIQGWNSVRIEISIVIDEEEIPTAAMEWQKINNQIEDLIDSVSRIKESITEQKNAIAEVETRLEEKFTGRIGEVHDRLLKSEKLNLKQSSDIAKGLRQIRLISAVIALVLGGSVLLSGIKGAKESERNAWLDLIRAGIPIVGGAIILGKLKQRKADE